MINYTYGNNNWKDQLTAYNGATIQYDNIGNPTSDGVWNYVWENGRQLKEMSKGTVGTEGYMKIEYRYNAEGLRIQKIVTKTTASGTTTTTTDYILHGKNIVHLIQGNDELHFFYDASNKPAIVDFNGTKYGYVQNLQGDIIQIIDANGVVVVEYTYDAWGQVLSTTGSLASTLGTVQPFCYRGYVYDVETGLYYLRSRYYFADCCRFLIADSVFSGNLFSYSTDNPINGIDPDGNETLWMAALNSEKTISTAIASLPFYTRAKHYLIGATVSRALADIEAAKDDINSASKSTGVPIAMIQAIMFRETICYGLDDVLSDGLPDVSTGPMQIKAETALLAEKHFEPGSSTTKEMIRNVLSTRKGNIYYGALRIAQLAEEYKTDYSDSNSVGLIFSSYNSGKKQNMIGPYGEAAYSYYLAFKKHMDMWER